MKKLVLGCVAALVLNVNAESDNVLVINGTYQIPVQAAIVLEQMKYDFYEKDWKAEAIEVMRQSLEDFKLAEQTLSMDGDQLAGTTDEILSDARVKTE